MGKRLVGTMAVGVFVVAGIGSYAGAQPVDQTIPAKLIMVKFSGAAPVGKLAKIVSKGSFTLADQATGGHTDGSVTFDYGTLGQVTCTLPDQSLYEPGVTEGWKSLGNPPGSKGFKYINTNAPGGIAGPCKIVIVKQNVIKILAKGTGSLLPPGPPGTNPDASVVLVAGWRLPGFHQMRYCASSVGGTRVEAANKLIKDKDAPAPGSCPAVCGDDNVDPGEDCDEGAANGTADSCCELGCTLKQASTACTDTDGNVCTTAGCDGVSSECDQNHMPTPESTPCPDYDGNECTQAGCDGLGTCEQLHVLEPDSTPCPDTDGNPGTTAGCDGFGTCDQLHIVTTCGAEVDSRCAFVTSANYTGDLDGLAGADVKCREAADSGLPHLHGRRFKAWLSDSGADAADRLEHAAVPYRLVDGTKIADHWTDMTDGTLDAQLIRTENGDWATLVGVWTGTKQDGTEESETCQDWTSPSNSELGWHGTTEFTDSRWTHLGNGNCDWSRPLYCVEQLPFVDNGDGTITDPGTGLMWEKKDDNDTGGIHDVDNWYRWAGCCDGDCSPPYEDSFCQPNAAAEAACNAQTGGAVGCAECTVGTCETWGAQTIWEWIVQVNAEGGSGFAGHSDWRLPSEEGCNSCWEPYQCPCDPAELETILLEPYYCEVHPCVDPVFNTSCTPGCNVSACSCTASYWYWSSATYAGSPDFAWYPAPLLPA